MERYGFGDLVYFFTNRRGPSFKIAYPNKYQISIYSNHLLRKLFVTPFLTNLDSSSHEVQVHLCMYVLYKYITRDFRALKNKEVMEPIRFQWIIFFLGGKQVEAHSYIRQSKFEAPTGNS